MIASGLVLTLKADHAPGAVAAVERAGPFTLGPAVGRRLPVALVADTDADARRWHDRLAALPGVERVDVAFVHLDAPPPPEPTPAGAAADVR